MVIICHNDLIFHANDDQMRAGHSHDTTESRGAGLLVSYFVDMFNSYLRLSSEEYDDLNSYLRLSSEEYDDLNGDEEPSKTDAREVLQYEAEWEGYWDNTKFMVQVELRS